MAKGMTIPEVKKRRIKLESDLVKLLTDFQSETGVSVGYIDMKWNYEGRNSDVPVEVSKEKRTLKDVGVNLDFDAIE